MTYFKGYLDRTYSVWKFETLQKNKALLIGTGHPFYTKNEVRYLQRNNQYLIDLRLTNLK